MLHEYAKIAEYRHKSAADYAFTNVVMMHIAGKQQGWRKVTP
jgi:hypothetical protein